jgi:post-segregation antitoxin (ccd killing protein)
MARPTSRVYSVCMPRVNVYLPAALADAVSRAELNVSAVLQEALRAELAKLETNAWLEGMQELTPIEVPDDVLAEALAGAKDDFGRLRP